MAQEGSADLDRPEPQTGLVGANKSFQIVPLQRASWKGRLDHGEVASDRAPGLLVQVWPEMGRGTNILLQ